MNDGRYSSSSARQPRSDREVYVMPTYRRIRSRRHRMHWGMLTGIIVILAILAGLAAWFSNFEYGTETSVVFTVKSLGNNASGSSHEYIVFTEVPGTSQPAEVFKDTDAWFHGKWNSSNLYNELQQGATYRCTVYGARVGFLSSYRDLLVCSQLTPGQAQAYHSEWVKPLSG